MSSSAAEYSRLSWPAIVIVNSLGAARLEAIGTPIDPEMRGCLKVTWSESQTAMYRKFIENHYACDAR